MNFARCSLTSSLSRSGALSRNTSAIDFWIGMVLSVVASLRRMGETHHPISPVSTLTMGCTHPTFLLHLRRLLRAVQFSNPRAHPPILSFSRTLTFQLVGIRAEPGGIGGHSLKQLHFQFKSELRTASNRETAIDGKGARRLSVGRGDGF